MPWKVVLSKKVGHLLDQFKHNDMPRVAISVDMLDTGIDVREIVNLVFAKPVYSYTKFWQMIGRGTRLLEPEKIKPWCPEKDVFLILDCWDNFEHFKLEPQGKELRAQVPLLVRLLGFRLDKIEKTIELGRNDIKEKEVKRLRDQIAQLPDKSVTIMDAKSMLAQLVDENFWVRLDDRKIEFLMSTVKPLFMNFIHMKGYDDLIRPSALTWSGDVNRFYTAINTKEINRHFIDYINFGGYPEVIFSEKIQANPGRYIKSDIVDKVLLRDLPSLYGIQDVQELNAFFTTLAYYSGNEVSLNTLSNSSEVEKNLLKKYLEYLEAAFLIKVVHRIDDNAKKFQRAAFYKIFLTNPSLRSALFSPLDASDEALGNMVETAIFAQWLHRDWFTPWYARWTNGKFQGEVDMVGLDTKKLKPVWALEIKWTNRFFDRPDELKSLQQFCEKNNLKSALVTTIDKEGNLQIQKH